ncbi:hypothetical protein AX15_007008, partial [Amanita polypyramis BW_CC]
MAPASLDLPSVPSPSRLNTRRPPPTPVNDRSVNQPNRRRTPSPASRRYVPPDRYVPPRTIVFTRDDYPNVYRPNSYRPDHSRRDSRSPSPGDRYVPPRNSDPIKASPMKGPVRRPRPPSPPRDIDRNRARPRRPDLMLASRMSDHPPTHLLPDRPRGDSWVETFSLSLVHRSRTASERPFPRPDHDMIDGRDPVLVLGLHRLVVDTTVQRAGVQAEAEAEAEVEVEPVAEAVVEPAEAAPAVVLAYERDPNLQVKPEVGFDAEVALKVVVALTAVVVATAVVGAQQNSVSGAEMSHGHRLVPQLPRR